MKKSFPIIALMLCGAAFTVGVVYLFLLRFEAGDVYPPYSTLRADPLGTMAFFESLQRMSHLTVRRDISDANRLPEERNTTYLHLAAQTYEWRWMPEDVFDEVQKFLARGGRLVVTFFPVTGQEFGFFAPVFTNAPGTNAVPPPGKPPKSKPGAKKKQSPDEEDSMFKSADVEKRWGVHFARVDLEQGADAYQPVRVVNKTDLPLPAALDWHSAMVFTNLDKSWRVIYSRGPASVVIERKFGSGSVVMASDSYCFSNEAMWRARHPDLLAWFVGSAEHVVFDEAHLGVTEAPGVAALMRKYRLHGVIGGLVLLAALFIWKNAFSLAPPYADETKRDYVEGKDASAGFVNLLRRNIPPREILNVCFAEWTKSLRYRSNYTIAGVDRASAVMEAERARPARARDPVRAYQAIARELKSTKLRGQNFVLECITNQTTEK